LLAAATKVVVTNSVEVGLLSLAVKRVALGVDDSVGSDNLENVSGGSRAVVTRHTQYGEGSTSITLKSTVRMPPRTWKTSPAESASGSHLSRQSLTLADGAVRLEEVGLEVHVEEVAREALDRVGEGKNVNATHTSAPCKIWKNGGVDLPLAILDVVGSRDVDEVAQLGSTVPAGN
jgi:hypothetical protein